MMFKNNQININTLPTIEEIMMIPVQKNYYKVLLIKNLTVYFSLFTIVFVINFFNTNIIWNQFFPLVISALSFGILLHFFIIKKGFKKRKYGLRERDISYAEGWLYAKFYTVPFVRVQHVEVRQGFISKYFKLANLKVFTAGEGDDIYVQGLTSENADEVRSFIISKINGGV